MPRDESSIPAKSTRRRLRCVCAGNTLAIAARDLVVAQGSFEGVEPRCQSNRYRECNRPRPLRQIGNPPLSLSLSLTLFLCSSRDTPKLDCPRRSPWIVSFAFVACRFEISQDYFYRSSNGRDDYPNSGRWFLPSSCLRGSSQCARGCAFFRPTKILLLPVTSVARAETAAFPSTKFVARANSIAGDSAASNGVATFSRCAPTFSKGLPCSHVTSRLI